MCGSGCCGSVRDGGAAAPPGRGRIPPFRLSFPDDADQRSLHLLPQGIRAQVRDPGLARQRLYRSPGGSPPLARLHARCRGGHRALGQGVRLLLRRGACGGIRVPGACQVSGPPDLPGGGDHPQPACQQQAERDGDRVPLGQRHGVRLLPGAPGARGDPPGVRRDDRGFRDAPDHRVCDGRHHLRLGAECVEAGGCVRT